MNIVQAAPVGTQRRNGRDSDWPARASCGCTFWERREGHIGKGCTLNTELTPRRSPRPPSARGENRNSSTARAPTGDNPVGGE